MRLMKVHLKSGKAVKLFRVPSTRGSWGSYRVVVYTKNINNEYIESESFLSIKRLSHAEIFYNWSLQ